MVPAQTSLVSPMSGAKPGSMRPCVVVVAGTHSGVGKTSITCGLMVALRQSGLTVQAFKVGPDFLDPMHHKAATGRPSINLDGWMLSKHQVLDTFHRHMADADIAVVEGVMGLFDSRDGNSEDGSTAQIAKWLGAPLLLVIDCWAMARSVAALVKGYTSFDQHLNVAGLLLNKVGGAAHGVWLREALGAAGQTATVLGCIPKDDAVAVSERYLGLTMPHEQQQQQQQRDKSMPPYLAKLSQLVVDHVDLEQLLLLAATAQTPAATAAAAAVTKGDGCLDAVHNKTSSNSKSSSSTSDCKDLISPNSGDVVVYKSLSCRCRIAVAHDEAFCFYYHDNVSLLRAYSADIVYFSPLRDTSLPENISGIYLGGGYPERYLSELSNNDNMLNQIRRFANLGGVMYAECGGLLYLSQGFWKDWGCEHSSSSSSSGSSSSTIVDPGSSSSSTNVDPGSNGSSSSSRELVPLVGVFPFTTQMGKMRMCYVEVEVLGNNMLFPAGTVAKGQVYHFSEIAECKETPSAAAAAAGSSLPLAASATGNARTQIEFEQGANNSHSSASHSGSSSNGSMRSMRLSYKTLPLTPGAEPVFEGYSIGNALASYVHLHWGGCPELAAALVDKCSSNGVVDVAAAAGSSSSGVVDPDDDDEEEAGSSSSCCQVLDTAAAAATTKGAEAHIVNSHDQVVDRTCSAVTEITTCSSSSSSTNGSSSRIDGIQHTQNSTTSSRGSIDSLGCRQRDSSLGDATSSGSSSSNAVVTAEQKETTAAAETAAAAAHGQQQQCRFCGTHNPPNPSSSSSSSRPTASSSSIISLLPSGTEILYALGLSGQITAVSGFCDWPHEARLKPTAVRSLVDVDTMTSDEIEQKMQAFKRAGLSPFEIDVELLAEHKPGLILTQDACQTCDADRSLVCKALQDAGLDPNATQLLILHPTTLAEVLDSIITVAQAAAAVAANSSDASSSSSSVVSRAHDLVKGLQERLTRIAAAVTDACPGAAAVVARCTAQAAAAAANAEVAAVSPDAAYTCSSNSGDSSGDKLGQQGIRRSAQCIYQQHGQHGQHDHHHTNHDHHHQQQQQDMATPIPWQMSRPARVLSLEGLNPLVLGGQWLPDVKWAAGCVDASGQKPGDAPQRITWQQVLEYAPDVLLLCPCSRSAAAALPDVHTVTQLLGFSSLPAVQSGRVYVIDHGFYSRPGPRLIEGVELLARLVYGVDVGLRQQSQQQQQGDMVSGTREGECSPVLQMACDDATGHISWVPCNVAMSQ